MLGRPEVSRWRPTLDDPPMVHRALLPSEAVKIIPTKLSSVYPEDCDENVKKKVEWSILQLSCIVSASLILLLLCLFPPGKSLFHIAHKQKIVIQLFEMAENFVLIVSITALFISFFQILMVFKLLKTHHPDATLALSYIEKTSFLRNVVQILWVSALVIYTIGLLSTFLLDVNKTSTSRGFAAVFGAFAAIACVLFIVQSMKYWLSSINKRKLHYICNPQFSTLV